MNAIYQKNAVFISDNVDFAYHRRYNSDQKDATNQPLTEERLKEQTRYLEIVLKEIKKHLYK